MRAQAGAPIEIVTGKSKRLLEEYVKPAVEAFLGERGLTLSAERTKITHIRDGLTFLGQRRRHGLQSPAAAKRQTFRKTGNVLRITSAKEGGLALIRKIGTFIRTHVSAPMPALIKKLNSVLRGWGNYHRHVVASEAFSRIDRYVCEQFWRMVRRRHSNKSKTWLYRKYWRNDGTRTLFGVTCKLKRGERRYEVVRLGALGIKRYINIRADANPYLPEFAGYYWRHRHRKETRQLAALSARQFRAMLALRYNNRGAPQGRPYRNA